MIDVVKKKEIESKYTKYEIARILGARALQISMNAPVLIKLENSDLERINYDPIKIAEAEFYSDILPITVKRPFPERKEEKAILFRVEKKKEVEEKEKAKEKEKIEEEKLEMKEEEAIKEEAEIMELAQPSDEIETEEAKEEGIEE